MEEARSRNPDRPANSGRARGGWTPGRIVSLVAGGVLALGALGLIVGGGLLLGTATSNGGWLDLGHATYETDSYAVVTEPADWGTQTYVLDNVDKVRIRVTPQDATAPVFVGMAPQGDVEGYLSDVRYVTAHGEPGYQVSYTQHDGHEPTAPPAGAVPWTVQSTGTGTQTLEFDAQEQRGDQVLVVMNADGSPAMSGSAESAATQPSLVWIAVGLLAGGIAMGVVAALLIIAPIRRARGRA